MTHNSDTYMKHYLTYSSDFMTPLFDYIILSFAILAFFKHFIMDSCLRKIDKSREFSHTLNEAYAGQTNHKFTTFQVLI